MRIARLSLVIACAASGGACSLVVSTDGLAGDVTPAPAPDATMPEAGVETSPGDASVDATDADTTPLCMREVHQFCASFDKSADPAAEWDRQATHGTGTLVVETRDPYSRPANLRVTAEAATTDGRYQFLSRALERTAKKVTIAYVVRVELRPSALVFLSSLVMGDTRGGSSYLCGLFLDASGTRIQETPLDQATYENRDLAVDIADGRWTRVREVLTFDPAPGTIVVDIDGMRALEAPLRSYARGGFPTLQLGLVYLGKGEAAAAAFDDVTVDLE